MTTYKLAPDCPTSIDRWLERMARFEAKVHEIDPESFVTPTGAIVGSRP